jgi:two-component system response regulator GlrR
MKTVLIVDDEPGILDVLEQTLSSAGYAVIPKPDAEAALDVIEEGARVDLAITDNLLPGMKGAELVDELKQRKPSMPVIMLTAHGSVQSYIQMISKGVFEYINKPIQAKELRRIVKAALAWSESRRT